jgi:uncharacterized protein (UPF0210 family)
MAGESFSSAGYEVQTLRISTRSVFSDMAGAGRKAISAYAGQLAAFLEPAGVAFCSLGPVPLGASAELAGAAVDIIAGHDALNCSVEVAAVDTGLDIEAARTAAGVMEELARSTDEGFGNFNFAAIACVPPGTPFFPAAYHDGPAALSVALQGASIVGGALAGGAGLSEVASRVGEALVRHAAPVVKLAESTATEVGVAFRGIDLSPAPDGDDSIAAAIESAGLGPMGTAGTLSLVGQLTAALRGTGLPTCGYCGLMLPVMEDATLAKRWEEGLVGTDQLLAYSAVCGTGLDTVPVAGNATTAQISRLICDVGTLAVKLRKPLTARLLPAPGKEVGERTSFSSPYLTNTVIRSI